MAHPGTLTGVGALVAGVATVIVRRHRTVSAVAPDLRTPLLWVPLSVDNRWTLAVARRLFARPSEPVADVTRSRHDVPDGRDVIVYEPSGGARTTGALLWIHGGGFILGHPEGDDELCSRIARDLGVPVVNVRYRLAPEQPFPAGLDDCFAALRWLHENAAALGVERARIAVGGASAGGGLAAAVVQKAHDHRLSVGFQLLVYPMLDDRTVLRRDHGARGRLAWTQRSNAYAWTCYLGHEPRAGEARPYAAAARRDDLSGLPPAWIGVGDADLFHGEDVAYARRLRKAGVPVDLYVEPGMYHGAEIALHATVSSMRAFRQAMFDALAAGLRADSAEG